MKYIYPIIAITLFSCATPQPKKEAKIEKLNYPITRKVDTVDTYFGTKVADPYRWLEDDNSEETAEWVKAENKVTNNYLSKIPFRAKIKTRLTELWNYEKFYATFKRGDKYFFFENNGLQNQNVLYVQDKLDGNKKVLLNPNTLSEDGTIALSNLAIRKDAKYAAYSLSTAGSDWKDIYVIDIETGKQLFDHIRWVKFSGISWKGEGFYYGAYDAPKEGEEYSQKNQSQKVYYHKLGEQQVQDEVIYQDAEHPQRTLYSDVSEDGKYLYLFASESTHGSSFYMKKINDKKFTPIIKDFNDDYTIIDNVDGKLLVKTNRNAPKYKLVAIDFNHPEEKNWKDVISESDNLLSSISLCDDKLIVQYLQDVRSRAYVYSREGLKEKEIELPGIGIAGGFSTSKKQDIAFYSFVNYTRPVTIYKYNLKTNTSEVYKQPKIDFKSEDYETKQVFYTSKDGTKIPMFITHKKGIKLDGNNPTFLFGYGGFNISYSPDFRTDRTIFLENNGVYAVANIRGGGEYGEEWHQAGTKLNKQNVFDDFIAAAEYLIEKKYTRKEKLALHGRSNGGLLVGAVMTQRPDLFQVALPKVGVLDMLRYHKFTIGWAWAGDYGRSDDSTQFKNLLSYSPLQNVKKVAYPATMVITGDHDDRVVPAHSFKFAATLQEKNTGNNPILIRIDSKAGHGSGKPVSKQIEEFSDTWAFVFYNLGMEVK